MKVPDNERFTWMNYWSDELWSFHKIKDFDRVEITAELMESFLKKAYDGIDDGKIEIFEEVISPYFNGINSRFIRLNRRSPKDSLHGGAVRTVKEAVDALLSSMRCMDDFSYLRMTKEKCYLYIMQYYAPIQDCEFRCFVKDEKLIAVTQYEPSKIRGVPNNIKNEIRQNIQLLFEVINQHIPLDSYVFDVWVDDLQSGSVSFLEINPYGMSDPCLFESYDMVEKGGFAYERTCIEDL